MTNGEADCVLGPEDSILLKKIKVRGFTLPDSKTHHKATVTKTLWYRGTRSHTDQWDRIQSPETDPHINNEQLVTKGFQSNSVGEGKIFNKWLLEPQDSHVQNYQAHTLTHHVQKLTQGELPI